MAADASNEMLLEVTCICLISGKAAMGRGDECVGHTPADHDSRFAVFDQTFTAQGAGA
jgi:hypothetical protein